MVASSEPLMSPDGRVVMVSGANRGIGLSIARRLHADGYRLSLGARRPDALAEAVADFADDRVLQCQFDAMDAASGDAWVADSVAHYGRLDGLVNNAGVIESHAIDDYDEERFNRALEVNLKSPYRLTAAAMPHLRKCGTGRIVNINSRSGLRYVPGSADYCITKFANIALTHAARYEDWDAGVRATALCPGPTATEMAEYLPPEIVLTSPDIVAHLVSLVLSLPNTASIPILPVCCELEAGVL